MENSCEDRLAAASTEEPAPPLEIDLLGRWEARLHGRPLPLRSRKEEWLLAFLALRAGHPVERDRLAGIFWPESSDTHALFYLRRGLTHLRRALSEEAARLQSPTPHTLALDLTGAHVDALRFDALIARADLASLEAAVALYRGPLLPACVESWVLTERQPREEAYLAALETLAAAAAARQEPEAAARFLRLAVAVDSVRETAQRALMAALAAAGDYAAATLVYREFRLLLHRELNSVPGPETAALFDQIRAKARAQPQRRTPGPSHPPPNTEHPTPNTAAGPPSNLPHPVSSFVGRESEADEVATVVAAARLVTLTGPGGVGKTRLALRVAEEVAAEYPDGAFFVDLAPLSDPTLVAPAAARALGVSEQPDRPLTETLLAFLRHQQILLVLDNCEHLLDACADLVGALLTGCPGLHLLATSRQSLGISGETVWQVPPLSLPGIQVFRYSGVQDGVSETPEHLNTRTPEHLLDYEAVRLFVERGTAATRSFAFSAENAAAVVDLCRRLDGIPLALELAAAWLKALSVDQIAVRLQDRFRLLTVGSRASGRRHQTLAATLDWSYDLLSEPERALLRRLTVFAGGFTLEAAEAVCGAVGCRLSAVSNVNGRPVVDFAGPMADSRQPTADSFSLNVLDLLMRLIDKSLVMAEQGTGDREQGTGSAAMPLPELTPVPCPLSPVPEVRYRLLETIREYGRNRLQECGEAEEIAQRHWAWCVSLAELAEPELRGPQQIAWLSRLEAEMDNLRAALEWSLTQVESEEAVRLAAAVWRFHYMRGHVTEGCRWLKRALVGGVPGNDSASVVRAKALHGAGVLIHEQGDFMAARAFEEESLEIWRRLGDRQALAESLDQLGHIVNAQGDAVRATALFEESLALRREVGDNAGAAASLNALGYMAMVAGEYERAETLCSESLRLRRELRDQWGMAYSLEFLGQMAQECDDFETAAARLKECLMLRRQLGDRRGIAATLTNLGWIAAKQCDWEEALPHWVESGRIWQEQGSMPGVTESLEGMATAALNQGNFARAAALHRERLVLWQQAGHVPGITICLEDLAQVACAQGQYQRAIGLMAAAEAAREAMGMPEHTHRRIGYQGTVAAARAALGEAAAAAWAEGRAMSLAQAVAAALQESCTL